MKAISSVVSVLLIITLSVALVGLLWIFAMGTFYSVSSSGTSTVNESLTTISSCMKIESVAGNQVSLRNCGEGSITQGTLGAYLDDVPLNVTMSPAVINKDDVGTVTLSGLWKFNLGGHTLRMANPRVVTEEPVNAVLPDSCMMDLEFDEGSGGTANDYSGNANNGTIYARHENLIEYSQDYSNGVWSGYCGSKTNIVQNTADVLAPDGTQTAAKFVLPAVINCGAPTTSWGVLQTANPAITNDNYTVSVWLKGANGGEQVTVGINDNNEKTFTLTNNWVRYIYTGSNAASGGRGLQFFGITPSATYYAWGAQLEKENNASLYTATAITVFNDGIISYAGQFTPWTSGKFGGGLLLDGADDYVNVSDISFTNQITMELWFKSPATQSYKFLVEKENTTRSYLWGMYLTGSSTVLSTYIRNSTGAVNTVNIANSGPWNDSTWHHLVGTFDGRYIKIYADGSLTSPTDWGSAQNIAAGSGSIYIGAWPGNSQYFNGTIDEVRIYNQALIPDQTIYLKPVSYD